jgi:hypothetical protein
MRDVEPEEFAVTVVRETENAILCDFGTGKYWIPKSLFLDGTDPDILKGVTGSTGAVCLPRWFTDQEGIA